MPRSLLEEGDEAVSMAASILVLGRSGVHGSGSGPDSTGSQGQCQLVPYWYGGAGGWDTIRICTGRVESVASPAVSSCRSSSFLDRARRQQARVEDWDHTTSRQDSTSAPGFLEDGLGAACASGAAVELVGAAPYTVVWARDEMACERTVRLLPAGGWRRPDATSAEHGRASFFKHISPACRPVAVPHPLSLSCDFLR